MILSPGPEILNTGGSLKDFQFYQFAFGPLSKKKDGYAIGYAARQAVPEYFREKCWISEKLDGKIGSISRLGFVPHMLSAFGMSQVGRVLSTHANLNREPGFQ
jgi:hypothetical protein